MKQMFMLNNITILEWCLIGVLGLVFIYQTYFYIRYIGAVARQKRRYNKCSVMHINPEGKGVSVIICARNEESNIQPFLQSVLTQDYPRFEVIVVNDGSEDQTQTIIDQYIKQYTNIKTTFVPKGARMGSTKKLALTLGAKAAQYDYLLLTDADCRPYDTHWISTMMQGFEQSDKVEVVLGYGAYFYEKTWINHIIQYDTLFNGLHYLGAAITGHPYMGVGRNLAYRKDTFFNNGGFTHLMKSYAGDDDLFVNRIANSHNTTVVLGRHSLTWTVPKQTWRGWVQQKKRHLSVSPSYRIGTKCHLILEPISRALFYGLLIAICVVCTLPICLMAAAILIMRLLLQYFTINRSAHAIGQKGITIGLLLHDISMPIITLCLMSQHRIYKHQIW